MSIETMKQALEALELIQRDIQWHDNSPTFKLVNNTANALRAAIQQAEVERLRKLVPDVELTREAIYAKAEGREA